MEPVGKTNSPIRFGVFEVDARTGELRKSGTRLRIQDQPFQLLLALPEHPGELVTREELQRRIWPAESFGDFDHAVNVAVAKLRAALGDSPDAPRYVETLHRRGYRFVYPLTASEDQQPVAAQSAASDLAADLPQAQPPPDSNLPAPAAKNLQPSWSKPALAIACSLAVLAAVFFVYRLSHRSSNPSSTRAEIVQISQWHKPIHDAHISPDGHMIAFDSPVNGISQVFVMLTSGGVPRQLTDGNVDKVVSTFSADGSELHYSPNIGLDELWSVPALGGPVRHLLSAYYAIPSQDGAYLYYATSDAPGIFRVDKTGLHSQSIFQPADDRFWNVPALVFPDGKRLVAGWEHKFCPRVRPSNTVAGITSGTPIGRKESTKCSRLKPFPARFLRMLRSLK
jgi:DNA-binding winged helix-turn-helix (wHTH) protein